MAQHRLAIAPDRLLHVGQSVYHDVVRPGAGNRDGLGEPEVGASGIGAVRGSSYQPSSNSRIWKFPTGFSGSSNSHDLTGVSSHIGNGMGRIFCWMATVTS